MAGASTSIRCRRNFESNGPDVKVRGNASHVAEKYLQLARDAQSAGDSVMAENYLQHAEHYFRIVAAAQPQNQQRPDQFGQVQDQEDDDDFPPMNDRFASPEPQNQYQPQQPQQQAAPEGDADENAPAAQQQAPQQADASGSDEATPAQGDGEPRRHRDRRPRRRPRGNGEGGGNTGDDPAGSPQPDVGDLPAFLTAGTTPAAE